MRDDIIVHNCAFHVLAEPRIGIVLVLVGNYALCPCAWPLSVSLYTAKDERQMWNAIRRADEWQRNPPSH